jgi:hypothetical protein
MGRDSSVGVATRYGLDGQEFEIEPSGLAVWGVGLRPLVCWVFGFESLRGHGYLCCKNKRQYAVETGNARRENKRIKKKPAGTWVFMLGAAGGIIVFENRLFLKLLVLTLHIGLIF